jgi:hypothetical protein
MVGRDPDWIRDEIDQRLDDYERALKRHGVTTTVGLLQRVLDPTNAHLFFAGIAVDQLLAKTWATPAAGAIMLARGAVSLASLLVERETIDAAHQAIAFVHIVKERLGTG